MAGITPQQMVVNIQDELHDTTLGDSRIYRWINKIQEDLDSRCYWHHLECLPPYQLSLLGPDQTGTVAVVHGSATVVGTGTAFGSQHVGQPFTAQGDNSYYYISAVNAQTLTLGAIYLGTTNAAASFSVDFLTYTLPSNIAVQKIKSVLIENPHRELLFVDVKERNELFPNLLAGRSQPRRWMDWGPSQIQFWPGPDAAYNVIIRYQARPTEVSASVTAFDWPAQMHRAIETGAVAEGWRWKDDNLAPEIAGRYEQLTKAHVYENTRRAQNKIVFRAFDEENYTNRYALIYGRRIG